MRLLRKLSAFEAWVILQERSWRGGIACPQAEGGGDLRPPSLPVALSLTQFPLLFPPS